jgi:alpha-methylacyl-CoA racemase
MLEGTDSCVTAVLTLEEAPNHPHMMARNTFEQDGQHARPGAAPRFREASAENACGKLSTVEADTILREYGFADDEIRSLRQGGIVG